MPPKPKSKKTGARAAATADQATMVVTLYDGTRQSIQWPAPDRVVEVTFSSVGYPV